jgi:chromosome segregation ATPase
MTNSAQLSKITDSLKTTLDTYKKDVATLKKDLTDLKRENESLKKTNKIFEDSSKFWKEETAKKQKIIDMLKTDKKEPPASKLKPSGNVEALKKITQQVKALKESKAPKTKVTIGVDQKLLNLRSKLSKLRKKWDDAEGDEEIKLAKQIEATEEAIKKLSKSK